MVARIEKIVMFAIVLAVAGGLGFFIGRNNARSEIAWLKDEVTRYADEAIIQSAEQLERQKQVAKLSETLGAYELELANGSADPCASDPAYAKRLRQVLEAGREPAVVGGPEGIPAFP